MDKFLNYLFFTREKDTWNTNRNFSMNLFAKLNIVTYKIRDKLHVRYFKMIDKFLKNGKELSNFARKSIESYIFIRETRGRNEEIVA